MLTINGRYLAARPSGVQRVANALVSELDRLASPIEVGQWRLVRPAGAARAPLSRLRQTVEGRLTGQVWEQIQLPLMSRSHDLVLSLCNTAPLMAERNLVMIHDAQVYRSPRSYSAAFRAWYRWLQPRLGRSALEVLTVSEFSKSELVRFGVAEPARIHVIPNGCDHLQGGPIDKAAASRLDLIGRPFVVLLGSLQAHKNVGVVFRAFQSPLLQGVRLVVVGEPREADYRRAGYEPPAEAIYAGAVSDAVLRGLLSDASALACPSRTEGFGLPPLEAMSYNCPVVVAPEGALPEVCGAAALYADADDASAWAEALASLAGPALRARQISLGQAQAGRFTWAESGRRLLARIRRHSDEPEASLETLRSGAHRP